MKSAIIVPRTFTEESPTNYAKKAPLILVVDVSYSMDPVIDQVNAGLQYLHQEALRDEVMAESLEIGLITFSEQVKTLIDPSLAEEFTMPPLQTEAYTDLSAGIIEGLAMLEGRIQYYRETGQASYRGYCLCITDGEPNLGLGLDEIKMHIQECGRRKKFIFWPIGVGSCNMAPLNRLADAAVMPAIRLDPAHVFEQIKLVTDSMKMGMNSREAGVQQANWLLEARVDD